MLRPSILPSLEDQQIGGAGRLRRAHPRDAARAKAASLCGTVTFTPAKAGAAHAVDHARRNPRAAPPAAPWRRRCHTRSSQWPCSTGDSEWVTGQPMTPASFAFARQAHDANNAFLAQLGQHRQQRQAQNREIIAFHSIEKLRPAPLEMIAAHRGQDRFAFRGQIIVQELRRLNRAWSCGRGWHAPRARRRPAPAPPPRPADGSCPTAAPASARASSRLAHLLR